MSVNTEKKHYIAFISYSTADEKWAKWLWHTLEYYRLPSNLRKERPDLPKHLRPVFWYKQDLSGTHLVNSLQKELDDSQYLIVICSPSSAQSEWVNKEVERFVELGRTKYIIPFIIAGTPHAANSADECFPPALRDLPKEQEIRGIDVRRQEGKQHAFIDIVATILGVRFNDLWQRHQRRRRKVLIRIVLLLLLLLIAIIAQIAYKRPHIEYYADYVDKWGMPVGIVPVSKEDKEHSHRTYQFKYRRAPLRSATPLQWRLERVTYINSLDKPQEHNNIEYVKRSAILFLEYSEQTGALTQIRYANAEEKILYRQDISEYNSVPGAIADFRAAIEDMGADFADADLARMENKEYSTTSAIKRFAYERDHNGFFTQVTFHSNNDDDLESSKVCDLNGIYGVKISRDSLGRIVEVVYVDKDGGITCTKQGVAGYRFTYDNYGSVNSYLYFDMERKPIMNSQKWAYYVEQTDNYGNTRRGMFYDEEGKLCNISDGYAQFTYEYDEHGNKIKQAYFDTDTMPCLSNKGIAGWKAKYNDFGWQIEKEYFGVDGQPCIKPEAKYASVKYTYNIFGKCTEEAYFGVDGNPCSNDYGYAKVIHEYNLSNQCVQTSYYDTLGHPARFMNIHITKRKYNKHNQCIEEAYFDENGEPSVVSHFVEGTVKWRGEWNSHGYITSHTNYDINGEMIGKENIKYDARGNIIELSNYGRDGQLKISRHSYARMTCAYDKQGNCIEHAFYDENNELFLFKGRYASCKSTYDQRGNMVQVAYHDTDGKLICIEEQYALQKMKYDERGNCIEKANYNEKQQLCLDSEGIAIYRYEYDERGNMLTEAFFGADKAPVLSKKGYAKASYEYDIRNKQIKETYYKK